jgi:hypothetical protein
MITIAITVQHVFLRFVLFVVSVLHHILMLLFFMLCKYIPPHIKQSNGDFKVILCRVNTTSRKSLIQDPKYNLLIYSFSLKHTTIIHPILYSFKHLNHVLYKLFNRNAFCI